MTEKTVQFEDAVEQQGFVQLPRAVLLNKEISHGAKLLWAVLAGFAWQDECCYPGQQRIADDLGVSIRTMRTWLRELEKAELVTVIRRGLKKTNLYLLRKVADPDRKQAADQERQQVADKVEAEEVEAETTNGGVVDEVFRHYLNAFPNKRQKKADEGQRKTIRNALEFGTADELKTCIDACAASDWHQKRGKYEGRDGSKHNSLSLILAPKTRGKNYPSGRSQREQIDYWLARTEDPAPTDQTAWDDYNRRLADYQLGEGPHPGEPPR